MCFEQYLGNVNLKTKQNLLLVFRISIDSWVAGPTLFLLVSGTGPPGYFEVQSICLLFVSWQSDHFWLRYSNFHIWPWKFKVKVSTKVKPYGHIWGLEFNRYVCILFRGNRTISSWDIANFMFELENSKSRSWSRSNPMVALEAQCSIDMFAFRFVAMGQFLAEIWQIPYLTLKIQVQGHGESRTKSNQVIYRSGPTIMPKMKEIQKVVEKLSREKSLRPAAARAAVRAAPAAAYEPVQKHKVTPGIPGWLNDYTHVKQWYVINHPFTDSNRGFFECEGAITSHMKPRNHDVITCPPFTGSVLVIGALKCQSCVPSVTPTKIFRK